jgi:hypothetical protein
MMTRAELEALCDRQAAEIVRNIRRAALIAFMIDLGEQPQLDAIAEWLIANGHQVTRENWIRMNYAPDEPPKVWTCEDEDELPPYLQRR